MDLCEHCIIKGTDIKRCTSDESGPCNVPLCWYAKAIEEDRDRLAAELAEARIDLSKPPQERTYCLGCSLPNELAEARREIEMILPMIKELREAINDGTGNVADNLKAVFDFIINTLSKAALAGKETTPEQLSDYADDPRWEGSVKP